MPEAKQRFKIYLRAFGVALFLWIFVVSKDRYEMLFDFPIEARNLSAQHALNKEVPKVAKVRLKGTGRSLFKLYILKIISFLFIDINSTYPYYYNFFHIFPKILISITSLAGAIISIKRKSFYQFLSLYFFLNIFLFSVFFILPRYSLILLPVQILLSIQFIKYLTNVVFPTPSSPYKKTVLNFFINLEVFSENLFNSISLEILILLRLVAVSIWLIWSFLFYANVISLFF